MSLKIEQRMLGQTITEDAPVIYSNGVFLRPLKIFIDDIAHFVWVVDSFNDDTLYDGKHITPNVISEHINEMFSV